MGSALEHYHAGLEPDERSRVQDDFVSGRIRGVVATTAFGMGIDKPDVRLVCLFNYPDSLESYVQMVGRGGSDGAPSETRAAREPFRRHRRAAVRGRRHPGARTTSARVYRAIRDLGGTVDPGSAPGRATTTRGCSSACSSRPGSCGAATTPAGRCGSSCWPSTPDAGAVVDDLLARYAARGRRRASSGSCDSPRAAAAVIAQVAEHFGETLDGALRRLRRLRPVGRAAPTRQRRRQPLPADVAASIVRAVERLTWPLGRRSLVAMLRGSVSAPPSARALARRSASSRPPPTPR